MQVTYAEFLKDIDGVTDAALLEPVTITLKAEKGLVLISAEEYQRLTRDQRRARAIEELDEDEIGLIAASEMEPGHEHLDAELDGWRK